MRLRFFYQPVDDIEAAATFYREVLGLEEAWREGSTVAFDLPGSGAALMLDEDPSAGLGALFFVVPSVADFYRRNRASLSFLEEPRPIPPGLLARFTDPSGNVIRVMDDSTSVERSEELR